MPSEEEQATGARCGAATAHADARIVANFAFQHLRAARLFREHVIKIEQEHAGLELGPFSDDICSYASACILSSAAALEALITELFIAHRGRLRTVMTETDVTFRYEIDRLPILQKYQRALELLEKEPLDRDATPFRDAQGLILLRNALVHFKPSWDPVRQADIHVAEVLDDRFAVSPFVDAGADFVATKCMSAGCARWAVGTVGAFVDEFDRRAPTEVKKMRAFLDAGRC